MTTEEINEILGADLNDEQAERAFDAAADDAGHWEDEAASGTLPSIAAMELDWDIDADLIDAGVDAYAMQRLSFAIAKSNA